MKKKFIAMVLTGLTLTTALSGCGNSAKSTETQPADQQTQEAATEEAPAAEASTEEVKEEAPVTEYVARKRWLFLGLPFTFTKYTVRIFQLRFQNMPNLMNTATGFPCICATFSGAFYPKVS